MVFLIYLSRVLPSAHSPVTIPSLHSVLVVDPNQFPDGENYRDVFNRLEPLVLEMLSEPQPVIVVAHLAVLRVIYG